MLRANAHLILGAIRLFNGGFALFAPAAMSRRLGIEPEANPSAIYPLRMFGVRTIVLGLELLAGRPQRRRERLDAAVIIHASDTAAAATAALRAHVPLRVGLFITGISALNTVLALVAPRPRAGLGTWLKRRSVRRRTRRARSSRVGARVPVVRDVMRLG